MNLGKIKRNQKKKNIPQIGFKIDIKINLNTLNQNIRTRRYIPRYG